MQHLIVLTLLFTLLTPGVLAAEPVGETRSWSYWDQTVFTRYRNLNDTVNELQALAEGFPDICVAYDLSKMFPYGDGSPRLTIEGRSLWALKISDDPGTNDTDEPECIIVATTHSREWISNEVAMFSANYIVRNYGHNASIDAMVNSTEIWMIPVLNPDGFQYSIDRDDYNHSYGLSGWRKNKNETNGSPGFQDYGSTGDGVDLNRNLGYKWGLPGASSNPNDTTYRGTAPYSEVENQILKALADSRDFSMALSYHSYGGLNLYPWGHTYDKPPEQRLLQTIAERMTSINGYTPQNGAMLYPTSGDFTDFFYGTYGVPSFTVEINHRSPGFIPDVSKIAEDVHLNIEVSLLVARLARDPYGIFSTSLNGTMVDMKGNIVRNATVNITGAGRTHSLASNGSFSKHLPNGTYIVNITAGDGLYNNTIVTVPSNVTFSLREDDPPVIENIGISVGGVQTSSIESGSDVSITVIERYQEPMLEGRLHITGPDQNVWMTLSEGEGYQATWKTTGLPPFSNYSIQAILADASGNSDIETVTVSIIDTTPPRIVSLLTFDGGIERSIFERGAEIGFHLDIADEEHVSAVLDIDGDLHPMERYGQTTFFTKTISNLTLGNHSCSATASDPYRNKVRSETITVTIIDTIAPDFLLRLDAVPPFRDGDIISFRLEPLDTDTSHPVGRVVLDGELVQTIDLWSLDGNDYILGWDSTGAVTGDYRFEVDLYDTSGNHRSRNVTFRVTDLTPPSIDAVLIDGVRILPNEQVIVLDRTVVEVLGSMVDVGSTARIEWEGISLPMEREDKNHTISLDKDMPGYGTYDIKLTLLDSSGNQDRFLFRLTIARSPLRYTSSVLIDIDTGDRWTSGMTGYVLTGEALVMRAQVSNLSLNDTVHLMVDDDISIFAPNIGTDSISVEIETASFTGLRVLSFLIELDNGTNVRMPGIDVLFSKPRNETVQDPRIIGYHRLDDGTYMVNITMDPPSGASFIVDANGQYSFEEGTTRFSVIVPDNTSITIIAVYRPFPEGADRNDEFFSEPVHILFDIDPPIVPPESDRTETRDMTPLLLLASLLVLLLLTIMVISLLTRRRSKVMNWEE